MASVSDMFEAESDMNIPELQKDLQRKYRNVGGKVEEIWCNWTADQRGKAMREATGDGRVLRNSRDLGLGGLRGWLPDWDLEDITTTPEFFIDRLRFRVHSDLHTQLSEGANGGPGDRQVIQSDVRVSQRRGFNRHKFVAFVDLGRIRDRQADNDVCVLGPPNRRDLGTGLREQGQTKKLAKDTTNALAELNIAPKPLKLSITQIIAQALEQEMASGDYLDLLRREPVMLNDMVNTMFHSRPELVPDDRGRILPLITDKYLSVALFDVVYNAVRSIVTWKYISDLLDALRGSDDKVKRPLILQELLNACQLEYRRAQEAFRRQVSSSHNVADKRFKRVTTGDKTKITLKGRPSDCFVTDPQLHYILRLCHHDTSHATAVDWIKKLDDHNSPHPDDRKRLAQVEEAALGDLAIIMSFMHTLSTSIASVSVSRKSGLLFTNRMAAIDRELESYKAEVDLGDYVVPVDNLLEPGVAAGALRALGEYAAAQTEASLGFLYEDMQQQCLDDVEKLYVQARARLEKEEQKTMYVPLTAEETPSERVERRREKEKTRGQERRPYAIEAIAQPEAEIIAPAPARIRVKASVAFVFDSIFKKSEARGSVDWSDFAAAMTELGFSVTPKGGSVFTFDAPEGSDWRELTFHRPHGSEIEGWKLLYLARRLQRRFGWDEETFEAE